MKGVVLVVFSSLIFAYCQQENSYANYTVVEVTASPGKALTEEDILQISPHGFNVEVLHVDPIQGKFHVLVSPEQRDKFMEWTKSQSYSSDVIITDLGTLLRSSMTLRSESLGGERTFERYMELHEVNEYLQTLSERYPHKTKVSTIGTTFHNESIKMISIADHIQHNQWYQKPIIFIEAGIHAREWISVSSAIYIIDQLVTSATPLTRSFEWRVVPILNPDGYKFTWTKNRLWRKNLSENNHSSCLGADLNRNFDTYWGESGTSKRKCSNIYGGSNPFSEKETRALRDQILAATPKVKAFISLHSYGQLLLTPPAHRNHTLTPECITHLNKVAENMTRAIEEENGVSYRTGSPAEVLYPSAGSSMDWAIMKAGVPLAFTFELRDNGTYGFLLPPSNISSSVSDIWIALNKLHNDTLISPEANSSPCTKSDRSIENVMYIPEKFLKNLETDL